MAYWRGVTEFGPLSIIRHFRPNIAPLAHGPSGIGVRRREGSLPVAEDVSRRNPGAVTKVADLESWKVLVAVGLRADVLPAHKNCAVISDTSRIWKVTGRA